jgi:3-oxoacyl-[acyl-carrier protein] reductase
MNLDLTGKFAIVCGSTQGLGFASAVELALLGANVTLVARNEEKLKEAAQKLDTSKQQNHNYFVADFQFPGQLKNAVEKHLIQNPLVNILVNNTSGPKGGPALTATTEEFLQAFNSHLICNHILVQAVVPSMKSSGFGRIINIISTSVKQPFADLGVSNTIRAAVANWAKTLANELGPSGITVNNVLPGFTQTARAKSLIESMAQQTGKTPEEVLKKMESEIPVRRIGKPEDFGAAVAFLCSPAAAYINGINLPVDGGRLATL